MITIVICVAFIIKLSKQDIFNLIKQKQSNLLKKIATLKRLFN